MKHIVTRELFAYWDRLRAGRSAPERADIDPAAIRGILADTFIAQIDPPSAVSQARIRLSGTRMNALFLTEMKGGSLLDLVRPADHATLVQIVETVLEGRCGAVAGLRAAPPGHARIDLELLLLPLRHHGRTHARLLGALAPVAVPSWLGLMPVEPPVLGPWRLLNDGEPGPADMARFVPLRPAPPSPRAYGYLVVHQGGR